MVVKPRGGKRMSSIELTETAGDAGDDFRPSQRRMTIPVSSSRPRERF